MVVHGGVSIEELIVPFVKASYVIGYRMNSSAPKIGFDRFIQLDWAGCTEYSCGRGWLDDLNALLDAAELGVEARRKHAPY